MESKSMPTEEKHTGKSDCPECARIEQELSVHGDDTKELVDALMIQWDGMIERMATNMTSFLKRKGREAVLRGASRLNDLQKKTES